MEDFEAHLNAGGSQPNTTSFYMRILRAVYDQAIEQELTADKRPFCTVLTGTEKTLKHAISGNDIRRIRTLDLGDNSRLELACDIFMFQFCGRGMSFIDLANLKKNECKR